MRIETFLRRFRNDERGAVVIIVAVMLTVVMGFMALGIDVGALYFRQKVLQTHADLSAVSAVSNLASDPRSRALDTVSANGLMADALNDITYGRFLRDPDLAPDDRLEARSLSDIDVNAARVVLVEEAPLYFARSFLDEDSTRIRAEATAARYDTASFRLASSLVSLEGGVLNAVLSEALGTTVGFDVLHYEALASADIDLLAFSDALATRLGVATGNYEDLLNAETDLADIAGALLDAGVVDGSTDVLTVVVGSASAGLFDVTELILVQGEDVTALVPDILPEITVSALDLLMASADIINAGRHVEASLTLNIPGVISTELDLVVGERPVDSGWITVGERGATLHTAQTRLKLDLELDPSLLAGLNTGLDITSFHLPVYIEVASATASLASLDCTATDPDDVIARFDTGTNPLTGSTGTHAAEIFVGAFDTPAFSDTTTPLNQATLRPADLLGVHIRPLGLGVLDAVVTIRAYAPLAISGQAQTGFTLSELPSGGTVTVKSFGSGRVLQAAVSALASDAELDTELAVAGVSLGLVETSLDIVRTAVQSRIASILAVLAVPLDAVLDRLLDTLGIGVGEADLALHGVACDHILLVR